MNKDKEEVSINIEEFPEFRNKMMEIADRNNARSKLMFEDVENVIANRNHNNEQNKELLIVHEILAITHIAIVGLLIYIGLFK